MGKPGSRWEAAGWMDAIDLCAEGASKEQRSLEEGDREGHGPKTGRSAVQAQGVRRSHVINRMSCDE